MLCMFSLRSYFLDWHLFLSEKKHLCTVNVFWYIKRMWIISSFLCTVFSGENVHLNKLSKHKWRNLFLELIFDLSTDGTLKCKPCFWPFITQNPQKSVPLFSVCCAAWPHKRASIFHCYMCCSSPISCHQLLCLITVYVNCLSWPFSSIFNQGAFHPFFLSCQIPRLTPPLSCFFYVNMAKHCNDNVFAAFETPFKTKFRASQAQRVLRF